VFLKVITSNKSLSLNNDETLIGCETSNDCDSNTFCIDGQCVEKVMNGNY